MRLSSAALSTYEQCVEPVFSSTNSQLKYDLSRQTIKAALGKIYDDLRLRTPQKQLADESIAMPIVVATGNRTAPGEISFFTLSPYRADSFKFFFDVIIHSLLPGKRMNVVLLNAVDFYFSGHSSELFTLCEVMIKVDDPADVQAVWHYWPSIEGQLILGLKSEFYARRILEIKGLSADEKTGLIFRDLAFLVKRAPKAFDQNLISDMQYFLATCSDEFKKKRSCRHMSRLIAVQYFFRTALRKLVRNEPHQRHFTLKLFKAKTMSEASVLGVVIGVNLIKEREKFEKRHLLKAIQAYIPSVKVVEDSFHFLRQGAENVCTLYCEVQKESAASFTEQEVRLLRKELPKALERRVEHLMHPVFMPRNEEEIYRNILALGSQIKYLRDIPQVTITFDEQSQKHLHFTVILVRVLKGEDKSIQHIFLSNPTELEYVHDRSQYVGSLRRKHKKEATVFRVKIAKDPFLRSDFTIDLNKARQSVFNELSRVLGDLRDFNGGMIAKQNEVLKELQSSLEKDRGYNELLLENFFYSLTPVILRSIFDPDLLGTLYRQLVDAVDDVADFDQSYSLKMSAQDDTVFVMIKAQDRTLKDELHNALSKLNIPSSSLANMYLSDYDVVYIGYIYRQHDPYEQRRFTQAVEHSLATWKLVRQSNNYLTVVW